MSPRILNSLNCENVESTVIKKNSANILSSGTNYSGNRQEIKYKNINDVKTKYELYNSGIF